METARRSIMVRIERLLKQFNFVLSLIYVSLVVGLISVTCYIYFTVLYGLVHETLTAGYAKLHTAVSIYFMFSVISNYTRCLLTPAGSPPRTMDPEMQAAHYVDEKGYAEVSSTRSETWRYCGICRGAKPPRTHHCSICNACFYKLCHHCPALGKCVGRDNYPFFWRFVMASWWGASYAAGTCAYLRRTRRERQVEELLFFMSIGSFAVGVATGVLGAWHIYLVATGQTTIEWLENIQVRRRGKAPPEWGRWGGPFHRGLRRNIMDAFGWHIVPWWWASLLLPLKRSAAHSEDQKEGGLLLY